jgi:hypothetical protein
LCISFFGSGSESIASSYESESGYGSCKKFRIQIRIHSTGVEKDGTFYFPTNPALVAVKENTALKPSFNS